MTIKDKMIRDTIIEIAKLLEVYRCKAQMIIEADLKLLPGKLELLKKYECSLKNMRLRKLPTYYEYEKVCRRVEGYLMDLKQEIKRKRG